MLWLSQFRHILWPFAAEFYILMTLENTYPSLHLSDWLSLPTDPICHTIGNENRIQNKIESLLWFSEVEHLCTQARVSKKRSLREITVLLVGGILDGLFFFVKTAYYFISIYVIIKKVDRKENTGLFSNLYIQEKRH